MVMISFRYRVHNERRGILETFVFNDENVPFTLIVLTQFNATERNVFEFELRIIRLITINKTNNKLLSPR